MVSLILSALAGVVSGEIVIAGEPEEIKTATWVGVENGKLACSVMKRTKRYDRESLDSDTKLYGGASYEYGEEMYSRWFREEKNSLVGVAIEAQHNHMRAN
ncbi:hypothetical protein IQ225_09695 [Synechocystis salina LEGE 06155]|nr:hypothetical protein [Synechocystis salina LEGE 06155]